MAADPPVDGARTARAVRDYYEGNTRLFLSLGIGATTLAMRRAVWADGVENLRQSVDYVNVLIAAEILALDARRGGGGGGAGGEPLRVLDIGCGVGGSLLFLCRAVGEALQGVGVTISPRQADIARRQARLRGLAHR
ncbi:MAG TPA: methyltransferase domain-containing protein, partial [Spirochaetia bacterium]|nr:methyltransferase domain-containing protein [Spirochaetia bacterium]